MHGLTTLLFFQFWIKIQQNASNLSLFLHIHLNFTAPQKLGEKAATIFDKQENAFQRNNIAQVMQPWQQQQQQRSNIPAFNPYFGKK